MYLRGRSRGQAGYGRGRGHGQESAAGVGHREFGFYVVGGRKSVPILIRGYDNQYFIHFLFNSIKLAFIALARLPQLFRASSHKPKGRGLDS